MNKYVIMTALMSLAAAACAQDVPAQRYVDAQGVEIIQNRAAPRPAPAASRTPARPVAGAGTPAASPGAPVSDARFQISAAEQGARDREREAILRQELETEMKKFEAATKTLAQAEQAARSQPHVGAVLKQLKEVLHAHQQNIESLGAELQRTRMAN
ncbi:hypothetical protein [Massilia consociata]|uniref:DUF4398 domain-containing protein n=1 Tax=Massilia consociata TaxID=760117 RepID=A0ABV6FK39_9BURK